MSVDTPKWNENNETINTIDRIKKQNIIDAIKFAEENPLPKDSKDFAEMKPILDKISSDNWKLAHENRENFIFIVSEQILNKISMIEKEWWNADKLRLLYFKLNDYPVPFFENWEPVSPIE